jgi:hypothetical protein
MFQAYEESLEMWLDEERLFPGYNGPHLVLKEKTRREHFKLLGLSEEEIEEMYCERREGD